MGKEQAMEYRYKMEELVPIVGKLAQRYTAGESTSVTYEKAEQLMGAVLYCIREAAYAERGDYSCEKGQQKCDILAKQEKLSAQQAYERGLACVEKKVRAALSLYNELMTAFDSYGNRCLYYPVLQDLSAYTGIDRIYEYLHCIEKEQAFLRTFPRNDVIDALARYNPAYEDMVDNICGAVKGALGV